MKYFLSILICFCLSPGPLNGSPNIIIDPPHLLEGMKMDSIELLIEIDLKVNENYIISEVIGENIFLVRDEEAQNKEYHYLSLYIDATAPAQEIKINGWVINGKSRDPI